ncbi:MAG: spore cortex biosynthesis protein YabQ [Clostridiales bacterium]
MIVANLIQYQLTVVLVSMLEGAVAAAAYDVYRFLLPHRRRRRFYLLRDLMFAGLLFCITVLLWFSLTDGALRPLDLVWFGCGAIIYGAIVKNLLPPLRQKLGCGCTPSKAAVPPVSSKVPLPPTRSMVRPQQAVPMHLAQKGEKILVQGLIFLISRKDVMKGKMKLFSARFKPEIANEDSNDSMDEPEDIDIAESFIRNNSKNAKNHIVNDSNSEEAENTPPCE